MGTQSMASQGGGTAGTANGPHWSHIHTLARQGSLYNLTLSEVESYLGEPLLSMNLDELLRGVLADDNLPLPNGMPASGLERQSSMTMASALSKKTVDEVWRGIQQGQQSSDKGQSSVHEAQLTLGEITLQDFLHRAEVVSEQCQNDDDDGLIGNAGTGGDVDLMTAAQDFPQGTSVVDDYIMVQQVSQPLIIGIPSMMDVVYPNCQMSSSSSVVLSDPQTPSRKRTSSEDVIDKGVDRRQKRMIKNRESAARSRARKQAYTNELENKLSRLEEENKRLKKEQELDELLKSVPPPEPKHQLQRTRSASF